MLRGVEGPGLEWWERLHRGGDLERGAVLERVLWATASLLGKEGEQAELHGVCWVADVRSRG